MALIEKIFSKIWRTSQRAARLTPVKLGFGRCPDFIILGAQRGGTTSLYDYLNQHPRILAAASKEPHYFDLNFHKKPSWYQCFFPLKWKQNTITQFNGDYSDFLTGEASPYYLFHPLAPERVGKVLPDAFLIALLRNPVDRAYSHYLHEVRNGREPLSFEQAVRTEKQRLGLEEEKILENNRYNSDQHQFYSYLKRGVYIEQLERWFEYFDREQMSIIISEDFFRHPERIVNETFRFLGIDSSGWAPDFLKRKNFFGPYPPIKPETRKFLVDFFRPYNKKLSEMLNIELNWE